jgi:hypothetical protein
MVPAITAAVANPAAAVPGLTLPLQPPAVP